MRLRDCPSRVGTPSSPLAHHPRLMAVGGGCPVIELGEVTGGLVVSGGSAEQDRQAAEAGLRALGFEVPA
ncbi:heme-binding protein [Streptomyces angustmyceticus]|uniref:heme-binding protein n=1 Tax=Streptomyces angustmyceticus TaxID=285578 RepID=UPI00344E9584